MKRVKLASASVATGVIFALSNPGVFASTGNDSAHALPIQSVSPANQATDVNPTATIVIALDPSSPNFNRFRQQFVNDQFSVLINGVNAQASFNASKNTITVTHSPLARYTDYTVTLLVKAMANGNTASGNASDSFTFETGSAIGESTRVTATVANPSDSVDNSGTLNITATDDYGDPATNATVSVIGTGGFMTPANVLITNGTGAVPLNDHTAQSVTLSYTVKDNTYSDHASDTNTASVSETFTPGAAANVTLQATTPSVVAGNSDTFTGTVTDQYGNKVVDGTWVNLTSSTGISTQVTTLGGSFSYTATDDTMAGTYTLTAQAGSGSDSVSVDVTAGEASKSTLTVPSTLIAGSSTTLTGVVTDSYGNAVVGQTITLTGTTATATTDSHGEYSLSFTPTAQTTSLGLTANGTALTLNGTDQTSVPVNVLAPVFINQNLSTWNQYGYGGYTFTGFNYSGGVNAFNTITSGGLWEQLYTPVTVQPGVKYTLSVTYSMPYYGYLNGVTPVPLQVLTQFGGNNGENSVASIPLVASQSTTGTTTFTATTPTVYLDFNYGWASDGQYFTSHISHITLGPSN